MDAAIKRTIEALRPTIAVAANRAVDKAVGLDVGDSHEITEKVTKEVAAVVVNQTNQEPLWRSRVVWGTGVAILSSLAAGAGYAITALDQQVVVDSAMEGIKAVGTLIAIGANLYALYGRLFAKKPLGQ